MYTAEEYRNLLKVAFTLSIHEAEKKLKKEIESNGFSYASPDYHYSAGYVAGLRAGLDKIRDSEFLSNPDFKD